MPTIHGEKIVLRILGNKIRFNSLASLGMSSVVENSIRRIITRPYGLFLVTGPTGAGKSSTLYTLLSELNTGKENIICLENPVEYELPGMVQVEIQDKTGLTFAMGLRASLRQDPDIIMVGEIRDKETAQLAIQAALTGHKVLSTIHTNRASGVVERLIDMGVEPFLVKAALSGAIAQRLARKICNNCCGKDHPCEKCNKTGYKGRIGLYEVLEITEETNWEHLEKSLQMTLEASAKELVNQRLTDSSEIRRLGFEI